MADTAAHAVSVASYNIHKCVGRDGLHQPERTFAVLRELDADIVGIQEFDNRVRPKRGHVTVADFEAATGYAATACPTMSEGDLFHGNLLLTRLPLLSVETHDASVPIHQTRKLLLGMIETRVGPLRVGVSHLSPWLPAQHFQARRLVQAGGRGGAPWVLLADSNEWFPPLGAGPVLEQALAPAPVHRTFPAHRPRLALDRIRAAPPIAISDIAVHASASALAASDHLPLRAVLAL